MCQKPLADRIGNLPSDPENDNEGESPETPSNSQNSPDTGAIFAVSTAQNLQLTADGEKSLLQFSQVFFSFTPCHVHNVHVPQA